MSLILPRKKSSHMLHYERKQTDIKMVQSIIRMKSELSQNFSMESHKRKTSLNKSKRQMAETLKNQKIAQQNRSLIFRIKEVRQKTMKDTMKYMDVTHCERLTNTRNTFRRKAKEQHQKKVSQQNQLMVKRIINTKSQYSYRNSSQDISDRNSQSSHRKVMLKREISKKYIDLNCQEFQPSNTEQYLDRIERQLQTTQKISALSKISLSGSKHVKKNSLHGKRVQTQALQATYNVRKVSQLLAERSKTKPVFRNPQTDSLMKKAPTSNSESIVKKNDLGKIPLKSRQIKIEVIKNPQNKQLKSEYDRKIKKQIEAKGAWGNEWLKSYRIVI